MSELEQKVLDVLTQAVPKLTEAEQARLLGFGEGVILNTEMKRERKDEDERQQH